MTYTVYILHSQNIGKYYIGYTSLDISERIKKHLSDHSGFTSKAKDWVLVKEFCLDDKTAAIQLERKIKKRGAKRYLES